MNARTEQGWDLIFTFRDGAVIIRSGEVVLMFKAVAAASGGHVPEAKPEWRR
ncbi:Hypothetical protein NGAL_HAMBI1146_58170 [Neorhizobium galegae bv. officinalis]|nr:Hypothetical protein NGAL_HAMBI490_56460 [Neorhizobium galegae bv. officinalis]CDZ43044.1 Hypothetical protein NGAL_HAMBI1146_58170 [Neorhizobium galegae bv. officinalis]